MGVSYRAHAIIGYRIENIQTILKRLMESQMVEQVGCFEDGCLAMRSANFCSKCGRESVIKLFPEGVDVDHYHPTEWFEKVLEGSGLVYTCVGSYWGERDEDHSEIYIGVGCESEFSGYTDPTPSGFIDHNKLAVTDVDNLKHKIADKLKAEFGDLWEPNDENYGLWSVLS